MNAYNEYGSFFIETEAVLATAAEDYEYVRRVLDQLKPQERRDFRHGILRLYFLAGEGISETAEIDEILGELMMIANDTAPD